MPSALDATLSGRLVGSVRDPGIILARPGIIGPFTNTVTLWSNIPADIVAGKVYRVRYKTLMSAGSRIRVVGSGNIWTNCSHTTGKLTQSSLLIFPTATGFSLEPDTQAYSGLLADLFVTEEPVPASGPLVIHDLIECNGSVEPLVVRLPVTGVPITMSCKVKMTSGLRLRFVDNSTIVNVSSTFTANSETVYSYSWTPASDTIKISADGAGFSGTIRDITLTR